MNTGDKKAGVIEKIYYLVIEESSSRDDCKVIGIYLNPVLAYRVMASQFDAACRKMAGEINTYRDKHAASIHTNNETLGWKIVDAKIVIIQDDEAPLSETDLGVVSFANRFKNTHQGGAE